MKDFMTAIENLEKNKSCTENGMVGCKTTYNPLVDLNYKVASYRNKPENELLADFKKVLEAEPEVRKYVYKYLYFLRDPRNGLGERNSSRVLLKKVLTECKDVELLTKLVSLLPQYGRWDDLIYLLDINGNSKLNSCILNVIKTQIDLDLRGIAENKPISLLAKWMPSVNTSNDLAVAKGKYLAKQLKLSPRNYRKTLSKMRNYLKVVEHLITEDKWDEIDYNTVPSQANLKYKSAFLKHDFERRNKYLASLVLGVDGVKMNASTLFPHDIVAKYKNSSHDSYYEYDGKISYDESYEQMWKNLKQMYGLDSTVVVRDGSGSMYINVAKNVRAIDVADALAIYTAERLKGSFKNKFITFSSKAKLVDLNGKVTLCDKLNYLKNYDDISYTNIANVFELILDTAITNNMDKEDLPKRILIVSDMEFNGTGMNGNENVFNVYSTKFRHYGYELPQLVFWNVNSRTCTVPTLKNNVILVSGFSVNIIDIILSGKDSSFEALVEVLEKNYKDVPYYD